MSVYVSGEAPTSTGHATDSLLTSGHLVKLDQCYWIYEPLSCGARSVFDVEEALGEKELCVVALLVRRLHVGKK